MKLLPTSFSKLCIQKNLCDIDRSSSCLVLTEYIWKHPDLLKRTVSTIPDSARWDTFCLFRARLYDSALCHNIINMIWKWVCALWTVKRSLWPGLRTSILVYMLIRYVLQKTRKTQAMQRILLHASRTLCIAFQAWQATAHQQAKLKEKCQLLLALLTQRRTLTAFLTWKQNSKEMIKMGEQDLISLRLRTQCLCQKAFKHWKDYHSEYQMRAMMFLTIRQRWTRLTLRDSFTLMRSQARTQARTRQLLNSARNPLVYRKQRAAMTSWQLFHLTTLYQRAVMNRAVSALQGRTLKSIYAHWKLAVINVQSAMQNSQAYHAGQNLRRIFHNWMEICQKHKQILQKVEPLLASLAGKVLSSRFRQWQILARRQCSLRARQTQLISMLCENKLTASFTTWRLAAKQNVVRTASVLLAIRGFRLRQAVSAWQNTCNMVKKQRYQASTVICKLQHKQLHRAFQAWSVHAQQKVYITSTLQRFLACEAVQKQVTRCCSVFDNAWDCRCCILLVNPTKCFFCLTVSWAHYLQVMDRVNLPHAYVIWVREKG